MTEGEPASSLWSILEQLSPGTVFPRDDRFYLGGTLSLTSAHSTDSSHPTPSIYDPYPAYNSRQWRKKYHGQFEPCMGPRGRDLDRTRAEDMVLVYKGKQAGFPESRFGSYEAMGLDGDVCTARYSRYGAYGFDEDSDEYIPGFIRPPLSSWFEDDWHDLQCRCFDRNTDRYKPGSMMNSTRQQPLSLELREPPRESSESESASGVKKYQPRSAVLIRAWHSMAWTPNHLQYLRALIMELSLHSGAEYEVFLLIHVKDDELPIFSDTNTIEQLRKFVSAEFRKMALFFNSKLLEAWYPKIVEHGGDTARHIYS